MKLRKAIVERSTKETQITVSVNLDGSGVSIISTPIKFLNHMLTSFSGHSLTDIEVTAQGDLKHHIVEDVAICLGEALNKALSDHAGITRFGYASVPMDCSLASASIDQSNRPFPVIDLKLQREIIEDLPTEDLEHFFESLAFSMKANIHVKVDYGRNDHHKAEASFKALALAFRQSVSFDPKISTVPSSKGVI